MRLRGDTAFQILGLRFPLFFLLSSVKQRVLDAVLCWHQTGTCEGLSGGIPSLAICAPYQPLGAGVTLIRTGLTSR